MYIIKYTRIYDNLLIFTDFIPTYCGNLIFHHNHIVRISTVVVNIRGINGISVITILHSTVTLQMSSYQHSLLLWVFLCLIVDLGFKRISLVLAAVTRINDGNNHYLMLSSAWLYFTLWSRIDPGSFG